MPLWLPPATSGTTTAATSGTITAATSGTTTAVKLGTDADLNPVRASTQRKFLTFSE